MTVYETRVPGVGRKYELERADGSSVVAVVHHDGKRELYERPREGADAERLLAVDGELGRRLGAVLEGAYFQPVARDDPDVPLDGDVLEWVDVGGGSELDGVTLSDADLWTEGGATVVAVRRDGETVAGTDAALELRAGDVAVVLGTRDEQTAVARRARAPRE